MVDVGGRVVGLDFGTVVVEPGPTVVVVDDATVVVVDATVVVVPKPSGNCTLEGGGGVRVKSLNEYTGANCPWYCGKELSTAVMKLCHSSAGMVPPWTLLRPLKSTIGFEPEA